MNHLPDDAEMLTRHWSAPMLDGIQAISLSFDGSNAERHDSFRGIPGRFEYTVRAAGWAKAHEIGRASCRERV